MATSKDFDNEKQWQTPHDQQQWNDLSDDDDDIGEDNDPDNHEFFDAHDTEFPQQSPPSQTTSTEINPEAELLHKRLNAQLSTNEETTKKPKSPGSIKNFYL